MEKWYLWACYPIGNQGMCSCSNPEVNNLWEVVFGTEINWCRNVKFSRNAFKSFHTEIKEKEIQNIYCWCCINNVCWIGLQIRTNCLFKFRYCSFAKKGPPTQSDSCSTAISLYLQNSFTVIFPICIHLTLMVFLHFEANPLTEQFELKVSGAPALWQPT